MPNQPPSPPDSHSLLRLEHAGREHLAEVRGFVQAHARATALSSECIDDLVLAVDEAATNIIVHGYADRPGLLEVEFAVVNNRVILTLRDQAPHFDPRQVPPPDLSLPFHKRKAGGLGVYMMRRCIDTLDYRPLECGNELTLTKLIDD